MKIPDEAWSAERERGRDRAYVVPIEEVAGAALCDGPTALRAVVATLRSEVDRRGLPPARYGHIISNKWQSEVGIYLDVGATDGATIALRCDRLATQVEVRVARSSRLLRGGIWASLAVGLVLSFVFVKTFAPKGSDAELLVAIALLFGAASGVGAMILLLRTGLFVGPRSAKIAAKLDRRVRRALVAAYSPPAGAATDATSP